MSRNYTAKVAYKYSPTEAPVDVTFDAGSLNDGKLSIQVPGRGAPGYGQAFASALTSLLSNSASEPTPKKPVIGELHFDRTSHRMMMYVGEHTTIAGGVTTERSGWMYLPASYASSNDGMLEDLKALRNYGDVGTYLVLTEGLRAGTNKTPPGNKFISDLPAVFNSTVLVDGNSTFIKPVVVNSTTSMTGKLTASADSDLAGVLLISAAASKATFEKPVEFNNTVQMDGVVTANAAVNLNSTLKVTGTSTLGVTTAGATTAASLIVTGASTLKGTTAIEGTTTATGVVNLNNTVNFAAGKAVTVNSASVDFNKTNITSTGYMTVNNVANDLATLEIGTYGELIVKGKLTVTGSLITSNATVLSVDAGIKPVTGATLPIMTKTFNKLLTNTAVTSAAGKVRMPLADAGQMLMVANDTPYDVTLVRYNAVDTVNMVTEDIVIGSGARMQFVAWAASSTKVEWALMNSFYG